MINQDQNISNSLKERLTTLCDNDSVFMKEFVAVFVKNATQSMADINQFDPRKSLWEIQQTAHKLKSNFLLFGFLEASALASEIEKASSSEEMAPIIAQLNILFPNILNEFTKLD